MEKYNHRDRIQMIIEGETPDRFAASFWRHYFHMENCAEGTAEAMVGFQKMFDWDFMKINPRADYHVQDWGLGLQYSNQEFAKHVKSDFPVHQIEDWQKIRELSLDSSVLAEHLKTVSLIRKAIGHELPILMTVFTPLAIAGRLVPERSLLVEHLRTDFEAVRPALEAITDTFARFATELRNAGADGLFFATTQWASAGMLSWEEYQKYALPYDLSVIGASQEDALNLLHVCSSENFLKQMLKIDFGCQLYNWDSCDPTNIPIDRAYEIMEGKTIVGGVDHEGWLLKSEPGEIAAKIDSIKRENPSSRLIIGPGCAIPPEVPLENLKVIRERL